MTTQHAFLTDQKINGIDQSNLNMADDLFNSSARKINLLKFNYFNTSVMERRGLLC